MEDDIFPESVEESDDDAEFLDDNIEEDFLSEEEDPPRPYGFTWKFDFSRGDIEVGSGADTRIVQDQLCLKQWLGHTLNVERYETSIYGGDIGTDQNAILAAKLSFGPNTVNEIEAQIKQAILVHDRIERVTEILTFPFEDDIFIYVSYITDDGAQYEEVIEY